MIKKHKFKINWNKIHVCRESQCMTVTGVVVNKRTNVKRRTQRKLRAKLHNLIKTKTSITQTEYEQLRGFIEWIRSLNPKKGFFFLGKLLKIEVRN